MPVVIGALIYTCWRKPSLLVFDWYRAVGLETSINWLRVVTNPYRGFIPRWFIFSFPDGLWVYAVTAFMARLWRGASSTKYRICWISLGLLIGVGSELGQLVGIIPGTFDLKDIVAYSTAFAVALTMETLSNSLMMLKPSLTL